MKNCGTSGHWLIGKQLGISLISMIKINFILVLVSITAYAQSIIHTNEKGLGYYYGKNSADDIESNHSLYFSTGKIDLYVEYTRVEKSSNNNNAGGFGLNIMSNLPNKNLQTYTSIFLGSVSNLTFVGVGQTFAIKIKAHTSVGLSPEIGASYVLGFGEDASYIITGITISGSLNISARLLDKIIFTIAPSITVGSSASIQTIAFGFSYLL